MCLPESDVSGCASAIARIADDTANKLKQILQSELNDIFALKLCVDLFILFSSDYFVLCVMLSSIVFKVVYLQSSIVLRGLKFSCCLLNFSGVAKLMTKNAYPHN